MRAIEALVQLMLQITNYVMRAAPIAVFAAIAAVIMTNGIGVFATYVKFIGGFYLALMLLWGLLALAAFAVIGQLLSTRPRLRIAWFVVSGAGLVFLTGAYARGRYLA